MPIRKRLQGKLRGSQIGRVLQATVIEVLGDKMTVRLAKNGTVLRGIPYSGGPVSVGRIVNVDWSSGKPIAFAVGESYQPTTTKKTRSIAAGSAVEKVLPGGESSEGGGTTFIGLIDTPSDYTDADGLFTRVNADEDAVIYSELLGGDGITLVDDGVDIEIKVDQSFSYTWTGQHEFQRGVSIVGTQDEVQLSVQAVSGQTENGIEIKDSTGTVVGGWDENGQVFSHLGVGTHSFFAGGAGNTGITGLYNMGIGKNAMQLCGNASYNVALGVNALRNNVSNGFLIAIGYGALYNNTATNNTAIGNQSMYDNTTGANNLAIGASTLRKNTTGTGNIAIGVSAMYNNNGTFNTAIGQQALNQATTGHYNVAIGSYAMWGYQGSKNMAIGFQALKNATSGGYNTAVGYKTLFNSTTGAYNITLGAETLYLNSTGSRNVAIGDRTLYSVTGDYNTAVGDHAGYNATGSFNVFLGNQAGYNETGSNKLYIANSNTTTPLIYGEFDNKVLKINGDARYGSTSDMGTEDEAFASKKYVDDSVTTSTIVTKTSNYTVTSSDSYIVADGSSSAVTITLPDANGISGRVYTVKCIDDTNTVTLTGDGTDTIDGSTSITLSKWDAYKVISDGTNWLIV